MLTTTKSSLKTFKPISLLTFLNLALDQCQTSLAKSGHQLKSVFAIKALPSVSKRICSKVFTTTIPFLLLLVLQFFSFALSSFLSDLKSIACFFFISTGNFRKRFKHHTHATQGGSFVEDLFLLSVIAEFSGTPVQYFWSKFYASMSNNSSSLKPTRQWNESASRKSSIVQE